MAAQKIRDHIRLQGSPTPLPHLPIGTSVKVYMGSNWLSGSVEKSSSSSILVHLSQGNKFTRVYDPRNIIRAPRNA
jgi:hypothetical protein